MEHETKRLNELKERLEKAKKILSMKDLEISDGELIKYNKHGQWSLNKEAPYWSKESRVAQQKKHRIADRRVNTRGVNLTPNRSSKPVNTAGVRPSVQTKYVNIPGKGRGKKKDLDKMGEGSLQGDYTMISY